MRKAKQLTRSCAVFILTHGRPNNVRTVDIMRNSGYTGDIYLIIDNEDPTAQQYYDRFGHDRVIMFDKAAIAAVTDSAETEGDLRSPIYARNATPEIARSLGLDYFFQFDDDYGAVRFRYWDDWARSSRVKSMDAIVDAMIDFLEASGATSVAMSQGGDHAGGIYLRNRVPLLRKAMNTFLFKTDRAIQFVGRLNDDVNTYVTLGSRGLLFFTIVALHMDQGQTQVNPGGMTELYLNTGTYMKSMTTVMMHPSSVTVRTMGPAAPRLHHSINWDCTVPKILSEKHRKP